MMSADNITFDKGVPLLRFGGGVPDSTAYKKWEFYFINYAIEHDFPLSAEEKGANDVTLQRKLFAALRKAVPPSAQAVVSHIAPNNDLCGSLVWAALSDYYDGHGAHDVGGMIDEFHRPQQRHESCMEFLNNKIELRDRLQLAGMGASFPPKMVRIAVIRGLRPDYKHVTTLMDENDETCDIPKMRQILMQHGVRSERQLSVAASTENTVPTAGSLFAALGQQPSVAELVKKIASLEKQLSSSGVFRGKCFNCGEQGHKSSDCPRKSDQPGAGLMSVGSTSSSASGFNGFMF